MHYALRLSSAGPAVRAPNRRTLRTHRLRPPDVGIDTIAAHLHCTYGIDLLEHRCPSSSTPSHRRLKMLWEPLHRVRRLGGAYSPQRSVLLRATSRRIQRIRASRYAALLSLETIRCLDSWRRARHQPPLEFRQRQTKVHIR